MRVAILSQFPLHRLPGMEEMKDPGAHYATWLPQLAESFAAQTGLEIHWITMSAAIAEPLRHRAWGQDFYFLPTSSRSRAASLFRADRALIQGILKEVCPDWVHGWGTEDVYGLAAVLSGYPSIVSLQGILSYYALRTRLHTREYFQAALELFVVNKATRLTTESEWGAAILRRIAPGKPIDLVEYGVQYHFLDCQWMPDPARPTAIFVGSITPRKGIQDAVRAFADPRLDHAELVVIGSGKGVWADRLRARSSSNVRWLGRQTPAQTAAELTRAWCLVLPTRADTSANVVKEARVIGLPVVCSRHGGHTTYVKEGGAGFNVSVGRPLELADVLHRLLQDFDLTRRCGAFHHAEHRQQLHPERTAEGFVRVYSGNSQSGMADVGSRAERGCG